MCKTNLETQEHILKCTCCGKRKQLQHELKATILKYYTNTDTSTATTRVMLHNIMCWLQDIEPKHVDELVNNPSHTLKQAVYEQEQIGWGQLFRGRMTKKWSELYNYDLTNSKNQKNGEKT
jgi:hypothetical protein